MNIQRNINFPIENYKFITSKDFYNAGISKYLINRLKDERKISQISPSVYENTSFNGEYNDFLYVEPFVKGGVVCLFSAAVYYGFSVHRPFKIDVAVKNKYKVGKIPEAPVIDLYYFSDERYHLGIEEIKIDGGKFKIYDKEKTLCDLLSYRNKLYLEDVLDALKRYLKLKDKDINKLIKYAQTLGVYNILSRYLEVLL